MTPTQIEERMRGWLVSGEYRAVIFEERAEAVAYALFSETETEVYLRQFFVVRQRRRAGLGRRAMQKLFTECWPQHKRWSVSALAGNQPALSFWRAMGYNDYSLTLERLPGVRPQQQGA